MTDAWDPSIPEHKELAHEIELGNGIPEMRPLKAARDALVKVGFEIQHEEDLAEDLRVVEDGEGRCEGGVCWVLRARDHHDTSTRP